MKDKRLVSELIRGSAVALRGIYAAYSDYVRTVVRNFSRGTLTNEDIDEITVDVFYKLWNRRDGINAETGLRPYLSAIARNAVKDRFKQSQPLFEDIDELCIPNGFMLEEQAEQNEMMRCLNDGLNELSDDEREIFFRFYFYGEHCSDIAAKLKISENNVHTKLSRTRGKLRKFLNERGFYNV